MGVSVRKKGGKWYVFVNHGGRRKARCVGESRAAALEVKRVLEARLALGDTAFVKGTAARSQSFSEFARNWLDQYAALECKRSTYRSYEQLLRLHVFPRIIRWWRSVPAPGG